jgi:hypothetical protein
LCFRDVRALYMVVTEKLIAKFPFDNDLLTTLGFVNPRLKSSIDANAGTTYSD